VNPPISTLPPSLELPIRTPETSTFKHYLHTGKAYASFYKTGAMAIFSNQKLSVEPQKLVDLQYKGAVYEAVNDRKFTRSDYQLLLRNRHDILRVPLFGLLFIVCGEFTPLIVLAVSSIVPYTCRIPKQVNADLLKVSNRRKESFVNNKPEPVIAKNEKGEEELTSEQKRHIAEACGLTSTLWNRLFATGPPGAILNRRVGRHLEYLETDDLLISRDGGYAALTPEEIKRACADRGIDVLERSNVEQKEALHRWFEGRRTGASPAQLLLLTPEQWPREKAAKGVKAKKN
jgi:hypothetical protein